MFKLCECILLQGLACGQRRNCELRRVYYSLPHGFGRQSIGLRIDGQHKLGKLKFWEIRSKKLIMNIYNGARVGASKTFFGSTQPMSDDDDHRSRGDRLWQPQIRLSFIGFIGQTWHQPRSSSSSSSSSSMLVPTLNAHTCESLLHIEN